MRPENRQPTDIAGSRRKARIGDFPPIRDCRRRKRNSEVDLHEDCATIDASQKNLALINSIA